MAEDTVITPGSIDRPTLSTGSIDACSASVSRRPILWLNVLCLDAPMVAVSWQWAFSRAFSVEIAASHQAALFFSAWFIYLIDRFADSVSLSADAPQSFRQHFCLDHRKAWLMLIVAVGLFDSLIVSLDLPGIAVFRGVILGVLALSYLMLNAAFHRIWQTVPIKEFLIGLLFAAGVAVVGVPVGLNFAVSNNGFAIAAVLFALLCSLNCVSIAVWERALDLYQFKHSIATRSPVASRRVRLLLAGIGLVGAILGFSGRLDGVLALCLTTSAGLLLGLHLVRIPRDERTALADLVLLTPMIFLFSGVRW
jgi:hypothetical protein